MVSLIGINGVGSSFSLEVIFCSNSSNFTGLCFGVGFSSLSSVIVSFVVSIGMVTGISGKLKVFRKKTTDLLDKGLILLVV